MNIIVRILREYSIYISITVLSLLSALILPVLDLFFPDKSLDSNQKVTLLLVIFSLFSIVALLNITDTLTLVRENQKMLEKLCSKVPNSSPKCIKAFYDDSYLFVDKCLSELKIEPREKYESMNIFLRLVDYTSKKYISVNCFSGKNPVRLNDSVKEELYFASEKLAAKNGVNVRRYFLLYTPEEYKAKPDNYEKPETIIELMQRQADNNIKVFFANALDVKEQQALTSGEFFGMALIDDEVFLQGRRSDYDGTLIKISVAWDKEAVVNNPVKGLEAQEANLLVSFKENKHQIDAWLSACKG